MSAPVQPPALPPLFDSLCDAEQLHGLICAAELVMGEIGDHPKNDPKEYKFRLISKLDEKTLAALLRSARQLADKLQADLGALA